MTAEVIGLLGRGAVVVDMTVGAGGHAAALLDAGVERVVGVDRDPEALAAAEARLAGYGSRVRLIPSRFSEIDEQAVGGPADGVLFDLGVSSMQLDRADRGFGYRVDGPLDMRMGEGEGPAGPSAADQRVNAVVSDLSGDIDRPYAVQGCNPDDPTSDATVTLTYHFEFVTPLAVLAGFGDSDHRIALTATGVMPCL